MIGSGEKREKEEGRGGFIVEVVGQGEGALIAAIPGRNHRVVSMGEEQMTSW